MNRPKDLINILDVSRVFKTMQKVRRVKINLTPDGKDLFVELLDKNNDSSIHHFRVYGHDHKISPMAFSCFDDE